MTKPLPAGTCNIPLNMTREERGMWGRAAFLNDSSFNQFVQECALSKLREIQPALAAEIAKVRQSRGMVVRLAKAGTTVALAALMLVLGSDVRRCSRTVRVRRNEFGAVEVVG